MIRNNSEYKYLIRESRIHLSHETNCVENITIYYEVLNSRKESLANSDKNSDKCHPPAPRRKCFHSVRRVTGAIIIYKSIIN